MPNLESIPAIEQTYLLNKDLISRADSLEYAVITVGGQAVQYWVSYYHAFYGDSLPNSDLITSVDVDYSARKSDINALANAFNIDASLNENGNLPSLAQFLLVDRWTKEIKQVGGRYFTEPGTDIPNTVDVIDRPAGFEHTDFKDKKLYLYTERFIVEDLNSGLDLSHDKIRVLNPIACLKSRFKNIIVLHRRIDVEVERIKALFIPAYYFLIEKFDAVDAAPVKERREKFSQAIQYLNSFYYLVNDRQTLRVQAEHEIKLYRVLESLMVFFRDHQNDYSFNNAFWDRYLPDRYNHSFEKYKKIKNIISKN